MKTVPGDGRSRRILFGAMVTLGGMTVLAKLAHAGREIVVAKYFGVSGVLDAFLIAYLLPLFAINVVAASLNYAFIPVIATVREESGRDGVQRLFSNVVILSVGLLGASSLLLWASFPAVSKVIAPGFSPAQLQLTRSLFMVVLPALPLAGLATIFGAVLNAEKKFALAAATPIATPVVTAALVVLFSRFGIFALALGPVAGAAIEVAILGSALMARGYSLMPRWSGWSEATEAVIRQYVPMVAGAIFMSGTGAVDQAIATLIGQGSVAALNYANKIVALILGVGSIAVGTAVMPYFADMVAARRWSEVRTTLGSLLKIIFAVTIPLAIGFAFVSAPLIRIVFERGSFRPEDTAVVAHLQRYYLVQLPFYVGGILVVRLLSALRANEVLMIAAALNLILNLVLDLILMRYLGAAGIALASGIVLAFSFLFCLLHVERRLRRAEQTSPAVVI
jgi:putative peptidoglycan lipid II flippase